MPSSIGYLLLLQNFSLHYSCPEKNLFSVDIPYVALIAIFHTLVAIEIDSSDRFLINVLSCIKPLCIDNSWDSSDFLIPVIGMPWGFCTPYLTVIPRNQVIWLFKLVPSLQSWELWLILSCSSSSRILLSNVTSTFFQRYSFNFLCDWISFTSMFYVNII